MAHRNSDSTRSIHPSASDSAIPISDRRSALYEKMVRDLDEKGPMFLKHGQTSQSLSLSDLFTVKDGSVAPVLKAADPPVRANVLYLSSHYSLRISEALKPILDPYFDKYTQHQFSAKKSDWGFTSFMPLSELFDQNEGYIVDDICVVEAEVAVSKADIKVLKDQETAFLEQELQSQSSDVDSVKYSEASTAHTSLCYEQVVAFLDTLNSDPVQTNVDSAQVPHLKIEPRSDQVLPYQETDSLVGPPIVEESDEAPSTPVSEVINFRGLGKIDKAFVPLLEEACLWHPSLISCQRKRSRMFCEWAFTALGRLLHFLNNTRVKDMMEDSCEHDPCEHLQVLWEEVEAFRFDLSWLEPFVQSALGMKKFGEREGVLNKLGEDVDALETEMRGLRERLAVAEVAHRLAKGDLEMAEESFGEENMNRKLGYGSH